MRQRDVLIFSCWIIAGGALGVLASTLLFNLWYDLGWRRPVADWLSAGGMSRIAVYWSLVWLRIPDWLIVGLTSIAAAVFVRRQLLTKISLFCISFVLIQWLVAFASGFNPLAYGTSVIVSTVLWNVSVISVGISLAVIIKAIGGRFALGQRRGFGVSADA